LCSVESLDRSRGILVRAHLDERESTGLSGHAIRDDGNFLDLTAVCRKCGAEIGLGRVVAEVADEEFATHEKNRIAFLIAERFRNPRRAARSARKMESGPEAASGPRARIGS
jgi:hypothetical protein